MLALRRDTVVKPRYDASFEERRDERDCDAMFAKTTEIASLRSQRQDTVVKPRYDENGVRCLGDLLHKDHAASVAQTTPTYCGLTAVSSPEVSGRRQSGVAMTRVSSTISGS